LVALQNPMQLSLVANRRLATSIAVKVINHFGDEVLKVCFS
jgi:hypothetical protein